jgi:hypothetical protein
MHKLILLAFTLIFSNIAFAESYEILKEVKFYLADGTEKIPNYNLTIRASYTATTDLSKFNFFVEQTHYTVAGPIVFGPSSDPIQVDAKSIDTMKNLFSICQILKGEIENITIKAGSFQACKMTYGSGSLAEWFIDGFPFSVKSSIQNPDGTSTEEALEIKKF